MKIVRGRKKAHWKVPALTRVRVRHRIHRWDGFLYNIDLFSICGKVAFSLHRRLGIEYD